MNNNPDNKAHKSFANEHSFDSCFKYETLIHFDFGRRMTHRDRRIIYYGISGTNPLNERIFNEIATMIVQKRTRKCTRKYRHFRCLR